ncbi:MAG: hypothetical protein DRO67_05060 [Candidatus Asgardarchaeum californiense]|nr:MAG: hypothetical protein DRO67_05060 [Candidatus Asgardarchaeum californiense]
MIAHRVLYGIFYHLWSRYKYTFVALLLILPVFFLFAQEMFRLDNPFLSGNTILTISVVCSLFAFELSSAGFILVFSRTYNLLKTTILVAVIFVSLLGFPLFIEYLVFSYFSTQDFVLSYFGYPRFLFLSGLIALVTCYILVLQIAPFVLLEKELIHKILINYFILVVDYLLFAIPRLRVISPVYLPWLIQELYLNQNVSFEMLLIGIITTLFWIIVSVTLIFMIERRKDLWWE